ncbi:MAG: hypothetical protein ACE5D7_10135, partial [Fidelibacterota bacterium]
MTVGLFVFLIVSCFDPVNLDHPDDPYSTNYILGMGSGCAKSAHVRLDAHSAEITWRWSDSTYSLLMEHGDFVLLNRDVKQSLGSEIYVRDTTFTLAPEDIIIPDENNNCQNQEHEIIVTWIDQTLTMEKDYRYTVRVGNDKGLAKDSVTFYYSHEFYTPDSFRVVQEYSDTSIVCFWKNPGMLHDKIKISWVDSVGQVLDEKIISSDSTILLTNPDVVLDKMTRIDFQYGLNSGGLMIWQRKVFQDTVVL